MVTGDTLSRFWTRVSIRDQSECWPWRGTLRRGYGAFIIGAKPTAAHRFAYELIVGPIPPGLVIDHLCRNRSCCNPAHLEPVTMRENLRRGENWIAALMDRTHCSRGHFIDGFVSGKRRCRICHNERSLRSYYRLKAARLQ